MITVIWPCQALIRPPMRTQVPHHQRPVRRAPPSVATPEASHVPTARPRTARAQTPRATRAAIAAPQTSPAAKSTGPKQRANATQRTASEPTVVDGTQLARTSRKARADKVPTDAVRSAAAPQVGEAA